MQVGLAPDCLHRTASADQYRFAAVLGARNMIVMSFCPVFKSHCAAWRGGSHISLGHANHNPPAFRADSSLVSVVVVQRGQAGRTCPGTKKIRRTTGRA